MQFFPITIEQVVYPEDTSAAGVEYAAKKGKPKRKRITIRTHSLYCHDERCGMVWRFRYNARSQRWSDTRDATIDRGTKFVDRLTTEQVKGILEKLVVNEPGVSNPAWYAEELVRRMFETVDDDRCRFEAWEEKISTQAQFIKDRKRDPVFALQGASH